MILAPVRGDVPICQTFGANPQTYKQFGLEGHNGEDLSIPIGTDLFAPIDGVCEVVEHTKGFGKHVRITGFAFNKKGDRRVILLAHFDNITVKDKQEVKAGDRLGQSGNTGYSFMNGEEYPNGGGFPHLHWQMRVINKKGEVKDYDNGYKGSLDIFQKGWIAKNEPSIY